MHSFLSAFFAPDVLGLVLLAVVGVFVFLLVRPREQDGQEDSWLAFMQQNKGSIDPRPKAVSKPGMPKVEVSNHASSDRAAGLSS
ncbi:MAG TPA: hypothetical protein VKV95_18210 [Terriglobia bacterium]|nr:hypothetical protein [Terriglobia bacterium]